MRQKINQNFFKKRKKELKSGKTKLFICAIGERVHDDEMNQKHLLNLEEKKKEIKGKK